VEAILNFQCFNFAVQGFDFQFAPAVAHFFDHLCRNAMRSFALCPPLFESDFEPENR
jgi:hypothetical protein